MNALDELTLTNLLQVTNLSLNYTADTAYIPPGTWTLPGPVCITKPGGKLTMVLNVAGFMPGFDLPLVLEGQPAGTDGMGQQLVRWSIDMALNKYIDSV